MGGPYDSFKLALMVSKAPRPYGGPDIWRCAMPSICKMKGSFTYLGEIVGGPQKARRNVISIYIYIYIYYMYNIYLHTYIDICIYIY